MNYISTARRLLVVRLLVAGYSIRKVGELAGVNKNTALRYMTLIKMVRHRGHRSPMEYRHKNQVKEWWMRHETPRAVYDEEAADELLRVIMNPPANRPHRRVYDDPRDRLLICAPLERKVIATLDPDRMEWAKAARSLWECRQLLNETNRQALLKLNAEVDRRNDGYANATTGDEDPTDEADATMSGNRG